MKHLFLLLSVMFIAQACSSVSTDVAQNDSRTNYRSLASIEEPEEVTEE
jgi:hypothetical protein